MYKNTGMERKEYARKWLMWEYDLNGEQHGSLKRWFHTLQNETWD